MARYRNRNSGAIRISKSALGYPYVLEEEDDGPTNYGGMKKSEIVKLAESRGVDSVGTISEIAARLAEADAKVAEADAKGTA